MTDTKPKYFYIYLNSPQDTFFVGYPISGFVIVDIITPKRTRSIKIRLVGTARTHWTRSENYTDNNGKVKTRTVTYRDNVTIVDQTVALWTPPPGMNVLPPGRHSFPFTFMLPINSAMPPTFREEYGEIKYYLTAEIDRPGIRYNHRTYRPITVLDFVDTNRPQYLNEMSNNQSKTMCCLFCKSKPIILTAKIPATAWCPGEILPVEVTVDNGANKPMNGLIGAIDRSVSFYARGSQNHKEDRLTSTKIDERIDPESKVVKMIYIRVPPCCSSFDLDSGRLIKLSYTLKVTLRLPAGSFNLHAKFPIVIGSIPHATPPLFRSMMSQPVKGPEYTWCTADAIAGAAAGGQAPVNPDALPPPPDFVDFESEEAEPQDMGGSINYVYFPMPNQYPTYGQEYTASYAAGGERNPLLGNDNRSYGQSYVEPSAPPPPPPGGVNFSASVNGFSGNIFSAPSAFVPVPKEDN